MGDRENPLRIAMWSGPRNISTALMRAFENRADTVVCDEPLYACYLAESGAQHPGREEVLAACDTDWRSVVAQLTGPTPGGAAIWYQKHMAHHLLPSMGRGWLDALTHVFLIRDPREMLLSLDKITPSPALEDTGLPQQVELFDQVRARTGTAPVVIDSRDVLEAPEAMLRGLCEALEIEFLDAMLSWPAGGRETDGVWAPHWYAGVEATTGFEPYRSREESLSERLQGVHERCHEPYRALHEARLRP
jgi:hypothetical protein